MVTVSVIIPTFNRARYVTKAIDSVLAQTYHDYEIIVVDDGSTDNTLEVLEPYRGRIKYVHQDNAGVSAARNTGIREATGEWIAFLDSDDVWHPEKLRRQWDCLQSTGTQVCFTAVRFLRHRPEGPYPWPSSDAESCQYRVFDDPFRLILVETPGVYVQSMVIAGSLLREVGGFKEWLRVSEDTHMIYDIAFRTTFSFVPDALVVIERSAERRGLADMDSSATAGHICTLSGAYFRYSRGDRAVLHSLQGHLAHALSRRAELADAAGNRMEARRCARDALHFGTGFKVYLRSMAILLCPGLMGCRVRRRKGAEGIWS